MLLKILVALSISQGVLFLSIENKIVYIWLTAIGIIIILGTVILRVIYKRNEKGFKETVEKEKAASEKFLKEVETEIFNLNKNIKNTKNSEILLDYQREINILEQKVTRKIGYQRDHILFQNIHALKTLINIKLK